MRWEGRGEEDSIGQFLKCNNCVLEAGENTGQCCQSVERSKLLLCLLDFIQPLVFYSLSVA